MSFIKDVQIIVPATSGLPVTVWDKDNQVLQEFEKSFCFIPHLQPLYTEKGMLSFFTQKDENGIYLVVDALDTHAILIKIRKQWVILGPYVTTLWQDSAAKVLLANAGAQIDMLIPYKIYRCNLAYIEQTYAENIAFLCLSNTGISASHDPVYIDMAIQKSEDVTWQVPEIYSDIAEINHRYKAEFQFLDAIQQGDEELAFRLLYPNSETGTGVHFISPNKLNDRIASAFALRVIVRHAAIRAGLEPVYVDTVSQEFAQKMHYSKDVDTLSKLMREYIVTFCRAIRENQKRAYSHHVKRAIQYIDFQLSQPISVDDLCKVTNITRQYLTQLFHKETGKSVKQYIMKARCDRAADLLENSNLPIQEISSYVGYADTSYFSRVFKSLYNVTPQEYRKLKSFY